ncbi:MAG: PDZ domain-containing protein, partial [Nitrospirota bacterium]
FVTTVEAGSPAEEYGLKAGDVVMQINKKDTKTIKDFNKIVDDIKKGDSILVLVYREGMTIYITMSP